MLKTRNIYSLFAVTAVGILAGCGGGGSNAGAPQSVVPITGGIATLALTDAPAVPATTADEGEPTTYITNVNGVSKTVYIAATSTAVPAGTPIAVFPDEVPIINASYTRAPGDIFLTCFGLNGARDVTTRYRSIVTVQNGNLVLTRPIGMTPGQYYGSVEGPLFFTAAGGKTLTVGSMGFTFEVRPNGTCSFPTLIAGSLPANGGHTKGDNISVTTTSPASFAGGAASLIVSYGDGAQSVTGGFLNAQGKYTFRSGQTGFRIPTGGVDSIQFDVFGPVPE